MTVNPQDRRHVNNFNNTREVDNLSDWNKRNHELTICIIIKKQKNWELVHVTILKKKHVIANQLMPEAYNGTNIKSLIVPSTTRNEEGLANESDFNLKSKDI